MTQQYTTSPTSLDAGPLSSDRHLDQQPNAPVGDASRVTATPLGTARPAELSVVVPTYNESGNLRELIRRLDAALEGISWELIIVDDDSPDGTAAKARALYGSDPRVRCLRRIGRRGLSSACIEGMLASSAPYLAVMDGDLQHDPKVLRTMLQSLRANDADLIIGSRYTSGGSVGDWNSRRLLFSRVATRPLPWSPDGPSRTP